VIPTKLINLCRLEQWYSLFIYLKSVSFFNKIFLVSAFLSSCIIICQRKTNEHKNEYYIFYKTQKWLLFFDKTKNDYYFFDRENYSFWSLNSNKKIKLIFKLLIDQVGFCILRKNQIGPY
jgi:hypothetical protein